MVDTLQLSQGQRATGLESQNLNPGLTLEGLRPLVFSFAHSFIRATHTYRSPEVTRVDRPGRQPASGTWLVGTCVCDASVGGGAGLGAGRHR